MNQLSNEPENVVSGVSVSKLNAPHYYASAIQIAFAGNDCTLIFSRPHPGTVTSGPDTGQSVIGEEPQCVLSLSVSSMKDLALLLDDTIKQYESEWGSIQTPFTRERAKQR